MKIKKQIIIGGKQQFADKIKNQNSLKKKHPKSKTNILEQAKKLLEQGNIEECLTELESKLKSPEKKTELLAIKARFANTKKDKLNDLMTFENSQVSQSKIIYSISELIKEIEASTEQSTKRS